MGIQSAVLVFSALTLFVSCGALDKDANCLNEKAACFKVDKTRPKVDSFQTQPLRDTSNSVTALQYIDVTFTEEIKDGEVAGKYSFKSAPTIHNFSVTSVQKISTYTYRLFVGGGLISSGQIELNIAQLTDYNGNLMDTIMPVLFNGSVNIGIVSSVNHNGVSPSGYLSVDIQFYHTYTADVTNANSYSIRLTSGAVDCVGGTELSHNRPANNLAPGVANTVTLNVPHGSFSPGMNRLVICINNLNNPNAVNSASWPIIHDNQPPLLTFSSAGGSYAQPKTIALTCTNNVDRIAYTSTPPQGTSPADPLPPTFNTSSGALTNGFLYSGSLTATNSSNPTYTKFMWRCIDISGNQTPAAAATPVAEEYYIDSTIPDVVVNLDSSYRQYISAVNPTTTLTFSTDQSAKTYNIWRDGTTCTGGGNGTLLGTGTTPATPGQTVSVPLDITTHFTTIDTTYPVRICVAGTGIQWGTYYLAITHDATAPTISASALSGSYGALQSIEFTCSDGFGAVDKTAYNFTEADGIAVPALPTNPTFDVATGSITGGTQQTGPISPPDRKTSRYAFNCIDRAGNQATPANVQYTIDATLPVVNFVSANRAAVTSNAGGYPDVTFTWSATRDLLTYRIRRIADCNHAGTPADTVDTGTIAAINTNQSATIPAASFPTNGLTYPIRICVYNYAGNSVYQTTAVSVIRDDDRPTLPLIQPPTIAQVDATNFTVSWNASSDANGIAGYRIYRGTAPSTYPGFPSSPDYTAVSTSATIAMPDTNPYILKIVPFDVAGNVPAAGATYTEITTKPTIRIVLAGLASGTLPLTDGTSSNSIPNGTTDPWTTTLGAGSTYNFSITTQPVGQVCAMKELQFGTLNANLTLNINCVNGYTVGQNLNTVPATKLGYRLFQGKNSAIAGSGTETFANGVGAAASFRFPEYIAHAAGFLYVSDTNNHVIRKIDLATNSVSVVAGVAPSPTPNPGLANGSCLAARFNQPMGIFADGTNLYVADFVNHVIRKISDVNGAGCAVTTLAGTSGPGADNGAANIAKFNFPRQIAGNKDYLFVADNANHLVRRIALASGTVDTVIGNTTTSVDLPGTGTAARIVSPVGLALVGNTLYASSAQNRILAIDVSGSASYGVTTIVAGDGTSGYIDAAGSAARFDGVYAMTTDGVDLYTGEVNNHLVRRVEISKNYKVTTIAGTPGTPGDVTGATGVAARFNVPHGIATDGRSLFIANHTGHTIRKLTDNGLVGFWPVDPGVNPNDYSGENNGVLTGTLTGGPLSTAVDRFGTNNRASTFAGLQYIATTATTGLPGGNAPRTLCAWVKPNGIQTHHAGIVSYGYTGAAGSAFGLTMEANNGFKIWEHSVGDIPANVVLPSGIWSHVCAMHNNVTTITSAYLNGRLVAAAPQAMVTGTTALYIGRNVAGPYDFNGAIANVRLYQRVLSEGEINELAQDAGGTAQVGNSFNTGATGLLTHYAFNDADGTGPGTVPSLSDNGSLNFTLANSGATTANGKDGDGNGAYLFTAPQFLRNTSISGVPTGSNARTLCAWVNLAKYGPGNQLAVAYGAPTTAINSPLTTFGIVIGTTGLVQNWTGNEEIIGPTVIPLNSWTHLCINYDGGTNGAARTYINGKFEIAGSYTLATPQASDLVVGSRADNAAPLSGKIDDVRIYNNVLSATQIRQLATQVPAGLMRRFDLSDDIAGAKAVDVAGSGENASISGATQAGDRFQQANQSYNFNGATHSISGSDAGLPTGAAARTLCSWIRPTAYPTPNYGFIFKYATGNAGNMSGLALLNGNTVVHTGNGSDHNVGYAVPLNAWTHICGTYNGTNSEVFINGASFGIQAQAWNTILLGNSGFWIGQPDYAASQRFSGDIDDVRIYNRVLSAAELRVLAGYHPMQATNALTTLRMHLQADALSNLGNNIALTDGDLWRDSAPSSMGNGVAANGPRHFDATSGIGGRDAIGFSGGYFDFGSPTITMNGLSICGVYNTQGVGASWGAVIEKRDFSPGCPSCGDGGAPCSFAILQEMGQPYTKYEGMVEVINIPGALNESILSCTIASDGTIETRAYKGGTVVGTGSVNLNLSNATNSYPMKVGARSFGASDLFNGKIGDLMVFTVPLGTNDRQIVECYLSSKYSIPLAAGVVCP